MIFSLPGATWCRFWLPGRAPESSWALFLAPPDVFADPRDAPGARRGRPKTLLRRSWNALGCHGVSSEGSGVNFDSIFGALEPLPRSILWINFSKDSDDSEAQDETREDLWKSRRILSEVAWKLLVIAMLCALSGWIYLHVQAMMGKSRKTLVISGATMHERSSYRAICTMEL